MAPFEQGGCMEAGPGLELTTMSIGNGRARSVSGA